MDVLLIGYDWTLFDEGPRGSDTLTRLFRYMEVLNRLEPGSRLLVISYTPNKMTCEISEPIKGLRLVPVYARSSRLFPLIAFKRFLQVGKDFKPDLISPQSPFEDALVGLILRRYFHTKFEVQLHVNIFSPHWTAQRRWINALRFRLARYTMSKADGIRAVSWPLREQLLQQFDLPSEKIRVVPVPSFFPPRCYDWGFARPTESPVPRWGFQETVLFVGYLYEGKDLPLLVQVVDRVASVRPSTGFVIVGDGPEYEYVRTELGMRGLSDRVHLAGRVAHEALPNYYELANVFILPSRYDSFGRVLVEAYLWGVPCVASRSGGPEDIVKDGETGFLVDVGDVKGFADRVLWLLQHPVAARSMGKLGQEYVQEAFDPEALAERLVQGWWSLVRGG